MKYQFAGALLAAASVLAQRPNDTSICDYYTTALLNESTAANQYLLLQLIVNTVVIGNYTQPNVGIAVPGILATGTYGGEEINLLPYFSGGLVSTNNNGTAAAVNFLDGGGASPIMNNMPANDNSTNQYKLMTHLYSYFGALLGCSGYGTDGFPAYAGDSSQFRVHRYMNLNANQNLYFITQVGLAAASFGVTTDDVTAVGTALASIFNVRCSGPAVVIPSQGAQLQEICVDPQNCSYGVNGSQYCSLYPSPPGDPVSAGAAGASSSMAMSMSMSDMPMSSMMSSMMSAPSAAASSAAAAGESVLSMVTDSLASAVPTMRVRRWD